MFMESRKELEGKKTLNLQEQELLKQTNQILRDLIREVENLYPKSKNLVDD